MFIFCSLLTIRQQQQQQQNLLQIVQDGAEEFALRTVAANVLGAVLAGADHLEHGVLDLGRVLMQIQMMQHVCRAQDHGGRIGNVPASRG